MFNNPSAYAQDMLLMGYSNFWSPIFCKDRILLFNGALRMKAGRRRLEVIIHRIN
jgi:hypothetical protein